MAFTDASVINFIRIHVQDIVSSVGILGEQDGGREIKRERGERERERERERETPHEYTSEVPGIVQYSN